MAKPQGDVYWSSLLASAFPPQRSDRGEDTAQVVIQVGKWIQYTGPQKAVRLFEIPNLVLPVTRMMKVRVFAVLRRSVRGEGVFVKKVRIPWPYVWTSRAGILHVKIKGGTPPQTARPKTVRDKLRRAYAAYKKQSSRKRRVYRHGDFSRSPQRPLSVTSTSYTTSTTLNEQINAWSASSGNYTAPVFEQPGSPYQDYSRVYSGVRTPNFRTLKGKNLPVNPYSLVETRTRDACDFHKYRDFNGPYWNSPQFGPVQTSTFIWQRTSSRWGSVIPTIPSVSDSITFNKAVKRLVDATENEISANLAQDFAQFGQTTRLIANTATRIVGSIRALKRGDFAKAARHLTEGRLQRGPVPRRPLSYQKTLASNWLELQYGWKPLLMDIDGAMRSTAKLMVADTSVKEVRGSAKQMYDDSRTVQRAVGETAVVGKLESLTTCYCRFVMRFRTDSHLKAYAAQTGFTNPVNLAWEILPFSFVLDWFLPIGPYLETLSAFDGLVLVDGSKTEFMKQDVTLVVRLSEVVLSAQPWRKTSESAFYSRDTVKHTRTKLTEWPKMRFPSLKNGVSITHAANALALLTAAFKH